MARRIPVFTVGALAALTALWLVSGAVGDAQSSDQVQAGETAPMAHPETAEQAAPKCPASGAQACSGCLPELTRGVDAAIKALENDRKAEALAELQKVKALLAKCREKCTAATVEAKFANDRCPISGLPIVPAKVTDSLSREYKGQRVAFCCGSCAPKWDKLTDADKDAKLQAVARR